MKSVFITGGSSGIGEALALNYQQQGYKVGICGRSKEKFLTSRVSSLENVIFYEADVCNYEEIKKHMSEYINNYGLDVFFANAGIGKSQKSAKYNSELDRNITKINVLGFLNSLEEAIKHFEEQGSGHIAAISSLGAIFGLPGNGAYCASKSFVMTFCDSLTYDLSKKNIDVTCIYPGYIKTPLTSKNNHAMPFLMSSDEAATKIIHAMNKNKKNFYFPFPFAIVTRFLGILPRSIRSAILGRIVKFN